MSQQKKEDSIMPEALIVIAVLCLIGAIWKTSSKDSSAFRKMRGELQEFKAEVVTKDELDSKFKEVIGKFELAIDTVESAATSAREVEELRKQIDFVELKLSGISSRPVNLNINKPIRVMWVTKKKAAVPGAGVGALVPRKPVVNQ